MHAIQAEQCVRHHYCTDPGAEVTFFDMHAA